MIKVRVNTIDGGIYPDVCDIIEKNITDGIEIDIKFTIKN